VDVGRDGLEVLRIESGIPQFGIDMDEDTIPLEAGIENRAISFTKGCYVGQEVIVRVLHRGHGRVAKKLVPLAVEVNDEAGLPPRGTAIVKGEREIGKLTSVAWSPTLAKGVALGYVHRDFVESTEVFSTPEGITLSIRRPS
jgi:folate-binding protein YgfZ